MQKKELKNLLVTNPARAHFRAVNQTHHMSPALIAATTPARLRNMTRTNRRRHTRARQSLRRITAAGAIAAAALAAAAAWTATAAAYAEWTDDATAKAAAYIMHGTPCTLGEIHHAPAAVRDAVWDKWTARMSASARTYTQRDRNPAATARVLDFATGRTDTVDEADLMDASPAAVRAAVDSGRLD